MQHLENGITLGRIIQLAGSALSGECRPNGTRQRCRAAYFWAGFASVSCRKGQRTRAIGPLGDSATSNMQKRFLARLIRDGPRLALLPSSAREWGETRFFVERGRKLAVWSTEGRLSNNLPIIAGNRLIRLGLIKVLSDHQNWSRSQLNTGTSPAPLAQNRP